MNIKMNPFNPNATVSTNLFAGRTGQILRVITKLEQVKNGMPASFLLSGVRGIGKTALAKLIRNVAGANDDKLGRLNFVTSYYSVENGQDIGSALQFSLNELTDQLPKSAMEVLSSSLGKLFKNGKFSIGVFSAEVETRQSEEVIALKDQMVAVLTKLVETMRSVQQGENKDGVLIIIDELHNVSNLNFCAQLFRGITTTLDVKNKGFVSFILIGYEETLDEFFEHDVSARRLFDVINVDVMPKEEAKEVLVKGFQQIAVTWDKADLDENIMVTGGYPHAIQMIGYNLVDADFDKNIGKDDWKSAIDRTARELQTKEFADMYNFKGKNTLREKILDILAVSTRPLKQKEIADFCDGKNIYQYIAPLKKSHSIRVDPKTDTLELHSHLFKMAILLHIFPRIHEEGYLKNVMEAKS
ncbi:MAG: ATP-binding protein [Candidatus Omnitrophica bacterium]|nr:ATP-binding protein [Candidatus Omnitrophota bacterium]